MLCTLLLFCIVGTHVSTSEDVGFQDYSNLSVKIQPLKGALDQDSTSSFDNIALSVSSVTFYETFAQNDTCGGSSGYATQWTQVNTECLRYSIKSYKTNVVITWPDGTWIEFNGDCTKCFGTPPESMQFTSNPSKPLNERFIDIANGSSTSFSSISRDWRGFHTIARSSLGNEDELVSGPVSFLQVLHETKERPQLIAYNHALLAEQRSDLTNGKREMPSGLTCAVQSTAELKLVAVRSSDAEDND